MQAAVKPKNYNYSLNKLITQRPVTLADVQEFLNCLSLYGLFGVKSYLIATENEKLWQKFVFAIAAHSVGENAQAIPCKVDLDGVSVCIAADTDNSILVNGESITGINLDKLQSLMRIALVQNSHVYSGEKLQSQVEMITHYLACDDFSDFMENKITPKYLDGRRLHLFNANCVTIFNTLIPVYKKKQGFPAPFSLSAYTEIAVTPNGFTLQCMKNRQIGLTMPFNVFFEKLRAYNAEFNPSLNVTPKDVARFSRVGWQGRLYNKNNPSAVELHPHYKREPYRTVTELRPRNLNCEAMFLMEHPGDKPVEIACCHLTYQVNKDRLTHPKGKVSWIHFSSKEALSKYILWEVEKDWDAFLNNLINPSLIDNARFGCYLQMCFMDMHKAQTRPESSKVLTLFSTDHVMGIELQIKMKECKWIYVVIFYEPNITNGAVRCETDDLATFKNHTLELYINGSVKNGRIKNPYEFYYKGNAEISIVMECNLSSFGGSAIMKPKKLIHFASEQLTPTHMHILLAHNCAEDILGLANRFRPNEPLSSDELQELYDVLAAKNDTGMPGLYWAAQFGRVDAIVAYGVLLKLFTQMLPESEHRKIVNLIAAKDKWGVPALYRAASLGRTDVVQSFKGLIESLPKSVHKYRADLIAAENKNGKSGFLNAAYDKLEDTLSAVGELIYLLPFEEHQVMIERMLPLKKDDVYYVDIFQARTTIQQQIISLSLSDES